MADNTFTQTLKVNILASGEAALREIARVKNSLQEFYKTANGPTTLRNKTYRDRIGEFSNSMKAATTIPSAFKPGQAETLNNAPLRDFISSIKEARLHANSMFDDFKSGGKMAGAVLSNTMGRGVKLVSGMIHSRLGEAMRSTKKALQYLEKSFKHILVYKVFRSALQLIIDGFKTGIENLYKFGEQAGTEFSKNLDRIKAYATLVKNSVAAMVSPIINYVTPIVTELMQRFADLANAAGLFFAKVLNQPFQKATVSLTKLGDAAKEAKKQIFGFDELNILNSPNGANKNEDIGAFETVDVASQMGILDIGIRKGIEDADWKKVGSLLAGKIQMTLESIDLEGWGKRIGEKISGVFQFTSGFLKPERVQAISSEITKFFNGAMEGIDFVSIGETVVEWFLALPNFLIGFFSTLDWASVGKSVSDFLAGGFNALSNWLESVDWVKLTSNMFDGIITALKNVDWTKLAHNTFKLLGEALGASFAIVGTLMAKAFECFVELGEMIVGTIMDKGIVGALKDIGTWIVDNILAPFVGGFITAFGLDSGNSTPEQLGKDVIDGVLKGLQDAWAGVTKWYDETIKPWVDAAKKFIGDFMEGIRIAKNAMKDAPEGFGMPGSFAAGGYVPPGDLFYANERGPELIGSFNGRTEVYNQDTFVAALASAMNPVVQATMAIGTQITGAVNNIEMPSVRIGDRDIYNASRRGANLVGGSLIQGGRA